MFNSSNSCDVIPNANANANINNNDYVHPDCEFKTPMSMTLIYQYGNVTGELLSV